MRPLTIAIRASGGEVIGLGHLRRCLSLAQALSRQGATVLFVTNDDQAVLGLIRDNGFEVTFVDSESDFEQTRDAIDRWRSSALVVDSYDISADYLTRMREHVGLLIAVDDVADRRLPVDMVINGAAYAPELAYEVLPHTVLLLGAAYVILREEFAQEPVDKNIGPAKRILITIGGSDPTGLSQRLLGWILEEAEDVNLDIVAGPFFKNTGALFEAAAQRPEHVQVHSNPTYMRSLMLAADLAITSGGQTTYELAATGTPAVAIATAEHQRENLDTLVKAGCLSFAAGFDDADLKAKLLAKFRELTGDPEKRYQMSKRGRALVDGRGAERLARVITEECARRVEPFAVRSV